MYAGIFFLYCLLIVNNSFVIYGIKGASVLFYYEIIKGCFYTSRCYGKLQLMHVTRVCRQIHTSLCYHNVKKIADF